MYETVVKTKINNSIVAVTKSKCLRCGSTMIKEDYNQIFYCLECIQYQEMSSEKYLLRRERHLNKTQHKLALNFCLSDLQMEGSLFLVNCYKQRKNAFLQAVCGAGKTEMCLKVILEALNRNESVAFVIPRVEIIKQVQLRLEEYFPITIVASLHSGQTIKEFSPLIVTTPQQLIKFYNEFDLIIIDEVDAFPLRDNIFLERLIEKSLKQNGVKIFMSATITDKFKKIIELKELEYFVLSKRYHKRPLSVPIFKKINDIEMAVQSIKQLVNNKEILVIYLPSIKKGIDFVDKLKSIKINAGFISSETKYKKEVLKNFVDGEYDCLVSTTILERGVTFSSISVVVVEADSEVFNQATLIQIAGRVGRISEKGVVIFMSRYISKEMIKAKKEIEGLNSQE